MTHDPTDAELAARLASWQPTPPDRDRMLFAAGAASSRAQGRDRPWALALAASLLATTGLGIQHVRERTLRLDLQQTLARADQGVRERPSVRPEVEIAINPDSYLALTRDGFWDGDEPAHPGGRTAVKPLRTSDLGPSSPLRVRDLDGILSF